MNELTQMARLGIALGEGVDGAHPCACSQGDTIDGILERQDEFDQSLMRQAMSSERFAERIDSHMAAEEAFKTEMRDRFKSGDDRMANIEAEIVALNKLVDAFDGFKRALMLGSKVAFWLGSALIGIALWVFTEKHANDKIISDTIVKHSIALERMVNSHQELERDTRRELDRLQRDIDHKHKTTP